MFKKMGRRLQDLDPNSCSYMRIVNTSYHALFVLHDFADHQMKAAHLQHLIPNPPKRDKQPATQQIVMKVQPLEYF